MTPPTLSAEEAKRLRFIASNNGLVQTTVEFLVEIADRFDPPKEALTWEVLGAALGWDLQENEGQLRSLAEIMLKGYVCKADVLEIAKAEFPNAGNLLQKLGSL